MKVSIITTCYNREATIGDAIESVLMQDYPDIEYIVVDGASQDGSLSIINQYRGQIATIISEPDRGMYEAINKGLRLATGDIVGLMHSDDFFYEKSTVSQLVARIEQEQADILYGNGIFVDAADTTKVVRNWISGGYNKRSMRHGWLPLHPTCYMRKGCLDRLGLYDESFKIAADSDFLLRYMYEGDFTITYLPRYMVRMRMGGLSTNPKRMRQKWLEDIRLYRQHGFNPYWALGCKIMQKVPQFMAAMFMKRMWLTR